MEHDLATVIAEAAGQVARDFNSKWTGDLPELEYRDKLIRALTEIIRLEAEHSIARTTIQVNVEAVIEELTTWIVDTYEEPEDD